MKTLKVGDMVDVGDRSYCVMDIGEGFVFICKENMIGRIKIEDIECYNDINWCGCEGYWCNEYDVDWVYDSETQAIIDAHTTLVDSVYQYESIEGLKKLLNIFKNHSILDFRGKDDLLASLSKDYGLIFVWHEWDGEYDCEYPYLKVIQGGVIEE